MQGQSPPAPTRGLTKKGAEDDREEADEEETDGGAADFMDLLPRTDIRSVLMQIATRSLNKSSVSLKYIRTLLYTSRKSFQTVSTLRSCQSAEVRKNLKCGLI